MRVTPRRCSVTGPEGPPSPSLVTRKRTKPRGRSRCSVASPRGGEARHSSPPPRLPALGSATPRCCHGPPSRPLIRAADHFRPGSEFLNLATSRSMLSSWDCKTIFFFFMKSYLEHKTDTNQWMSVSRQFKSSLFIEP